MNDPLSHGSRSRAAAINDRYKRSLMTFGDARFRIRIAANDVIFEIDVASSPSGLACVTPPIAWRQYRAGQIACELIPAYDEIRRVKGISPRSAHPAREAEACIAIAIAPHDRRRAEPQSSPGDPTGRAPPRASPGNGTDSPRSRNFLEYGLR